MAEIPHAVSFNDESTTPTAASHFYSEDAPGLNFDKPIGTETQATAHFNFREWVRFGFGSRPSGNALQGSLGSDVFLWNSRYEVILQENGTWKRTSEENNDIGPGPITINPLP